MSKHLTEWDIQVLLDGNLPAAVARVFREHLQQCNPCRKQFEQYTQVYRALNTEPESLPENFTDRVVSALHLESPKKDSFFNKEILLTGIFALLGLGISLYFTGVDFLLSFFRNMKLPHLNVEFTALKQILGLWNALHLDLPVVLAGIVLLILVAVADSVIFQRH